MNQLKYLGIASAALMLCACSGDDLVQTEKGHGRLSVTADVNSSLLSSRASRASTENGVVSITADDLAFSLANAEGTVVANWASLSELAANSSVPVGEYTLSASYGEPDAMGFEAPYFFGSASVKVRENETTQVGLTASLANSMVTVSYSESLKKYLTSYSAELMCAGAPATIQYAADEIRPAYVKTGNVDVYVNVTKPSGASVRLLAATFETQPQHHYLVTVDMNGGESNQGQLVVAFDDDLVQEDYVVDLSDELMNAPAPEVAATGFDTDTPAQAVAGVPFAGTLRYDVIARGKLGQVKLATTNPELIDPAWPAEANLMALSAADQAKLQSLGLSAKGLWRNPDKIAIVDLSSVVGHISIPDGADDCQVKFSLTVIDKFGKASEPAPVLTVNVSKETIAISNPAKMYVGDPTFTVDLAYNGATPEGVIAFQYANDRGTWSNLGAASFTKVSDGLYKAVVPAVDTDMPFSVRAANTAGTLVSNVLAITPVLSENYETTVVDAWPRKAYLKVHEGEKQFAKYATAYVSADGTNYAKAASTVDGDKLVVTGLEPGTSYYVKASLSASKDEASPAVQFTTEPATQLPNAGMEQWCEPTTFSNSTLWVPGKSAESTVWETNNRLTTSQSDPRAYCCTSGTLRSSDKHSGDYAAQIRTVGWGSGNTAAGGVSIIKHITAGELYLGSWGGVDNPNNYGYAFASRPASMSFWCKYSPKNSNDKGYAEISVLDSDGNIITSGSLDIESLGEYAQKTISLAYPASAPKAASIQIIFRSTNAGDKYLTSGDLNKGSVSRTAEHVGSQLWIDDITLNY